MNLFSVALELNSWVFSIVIFSTIIFFGTFFASSAYFSKDSINEKDPEKKRARSKFLKKVKSDAENQKRK